jgi:class 3 adenylate cyclase
MPRFLSGRVGRALLLGLAVSLGVSALSRVGALAGWFLVSGAARAVLGDRVIVRERGALPLKGKAEPVEVYEVIGLAGEAEVRDATAGGRPSE